MSTEYLSRSICALIGMNNIIHIAPTKEMIFIKTLDLEKEESKVQVL